MGLVDLAQFGEQAVLFRNAAGIWDLARQKVVLPLPWRRIQAHKDSRRHFRAFRGWKYRRNFRPANR